jgi:hypothetical protein
MGAFSELRDALRLCDPRNGGHISRTSREIITVFVQAGDWANSPSLCYEKPLTTFIFLLK